MDTKKPTEAELEILQVIWKNGPSSVREINQELQKDREVGYTTTLKIMQIMHQKGLLTRKKSGKLHVYDVAITREETQTQVLRKLMDGFFQGSALKLAMHVLGSTHSSQEDLEEIRAFLTQIEKKNGDK